VLVKRHGHASLLFGLYLFGLLRSDGSVAAGHGLLAHEEAESGGVGEVALARLAHGHRRRGADGLPGRRSGRLPPQLDLVAALAQGQLRIGPTHVGAVAGVRVLLLRRAPPLPPVELVQVRRATSAEIGVIRLVGPARPDGVANAMEGVHGRRDELDGTASVEHGRRRRVVRVVFGIALVIRAVLILRAI
jgi:hypothetical protein